MSSLVPRGDLRIYQFESFEAGLTQGLFSRHGGISPEPWASLNLGSTVGDDPERVKENRRLAFTAMGRDPLSLYDAWLVHGTDVAIAEAPRAATEKHQQADIILTDKPEITLLMRFADCVPVLLHDPVRKVVGIAHAGWPGTVKGTVRRAVEVMKAHYGCEAGDIRAGIGPSIGPDHYEIGVDVEARVKESFGGDAGNLLTWRDGRLYFDLWKANRLLLENAGVRHIELSGICTACHNADWYSHRAEKGRTGRFGAMMALKGSSWTQP